MRVSERVHGAGGLEKWLLHYHDAPVDRPHRPAYRLEPAYLFLARARGV